MPKAFPTLTPDEVIAILLARGFVLAHSSGSHSHYKGTIRGRGRLVTVDTQYDQFDVGRIKDMMAQSGLARKEFYGSTKQTAKKINLRRVEVPVPSKD